MIIDSLHLTSIWNFAAGNSLVIVTANSPPEPGQRIDIEILDGSDRGNVYLSKKASPAHPLSIWLLNV